MVRDADQVWRRLAAGAGLDGLGLGAVDGRVDLRGIGPPAFPWTAKDPLPLLRSAGLRGLDLTNARLPNFRLIDCRIEDCVLDGAELEDWRLWGTEVRECSFRQATLDAGMGGDRRGANTWERVDFSGGDLRGSSHTHEEYRDCDFFGARLKRVDFNGSRHVRSRFSGLLFDVEFRRDASGVDDGLLSRWRPRPPNQMDGVDLGAATLRYGTFRGLDPSACVLPSSPDHLRFLDRGLFAARVLANADVNPSLRAAMEVHVRDAPAGGGGPGFQHVRDLGDTPDEIAAAVALLRSLGAT